MNDLFNTRSPTQEVSRSESDHTDLDGQVTVPTPSALPGSLDTRSDEEARYATGSAHDPPRISRSSGVMKKRWRRSRSRLLVADPLALCAYRRRVPGNESGGFIGIVGLLRQPEHLDPVSILRDLDARGDRDLRR